MSVITLVTSLMMGLSLLGSAPKLLGSDAVFEPLSIETGDKVHSFQVELARTPKEQAQGLMFRKSMAHDEGMLFTLKKPRTVSFWMKNTYIPLDLLFIDRHGTVLKIIANAEPHSLTSRPSDGPVSAVLEINGGLSEKLGIAPGQTVRHTFFKNFDE